MKSFAKIFLFLFIFTSGIFSVEAWFFDAFISDDDTTTRYCDEDGECGLDTWIDVVKNTLNGVETERPASQYIQEVVLYLLSFVSLIAVLIIIYAWFQILVAQGDDEKLKSSKHIIMYVFFGIVVMWLAWPITRFILAVISA